MSIREFRVITPQAIPLVLIVGFGLASAALATTDFTIVGVGPNGNNLAGVYTDPYEATVGVSSVLAFCDDYLDEVTPPESWDALVTNLSSLSTPSSNVYFSDGVVNGTSYSQDQLYTAAAILAVESTQIYDADPTNANPNDVTAENDLSFALWDLFDPSLLASNQAGLGSTDLSNADTYLAIALTDAVSNPSAALDGATVQIYTPTTNGTSPETDSSRPQEFITVSLPGVPEPGSWTTLLADMIGLAIIGLVFQRRRIRTLLSK